jgi:hypothetical protein
VTLRSLAALYGVTPNRLLAVLPYAVARAEALDAFDAARSLPNTLATALGASDAPAPTRAHVFHGTRALDPAAFARRGLLPLSAVLDDLWSQLSALVPDLSASDLSGVREDLAAGRLGRPTYAHRLACGVREDGPLGLLIRDIHLRPEDFSSVDYLAAPEIVADICDAVDERFTAGLRDRFERVSVPCIVEFAVPADDVSDALASAAWYLHEALRGEARGIDHGTNFDGEGTPVPPSAIVSVEQDPR